MKPQNRPETPDTPSSPPAAPSGVSSPEVWPVGTHVVFTEHARASMRNGSLRVPAGGPDAVYTVHSPSGNAVVVLAENGERWGVWWLKEAPSLPEPAVDEAPAAKPKAKKKRKKAKAPARTGILICQVTVTYIPDEFSRRTQSSVIQARTQVTDHYSEGDVRFMAEMALRPAVHSIDETREELV